MAARILFSEGSSLTAREFLSVLGPAGHHIEVVDPNPVCICRFSRWTRRVHHAPPPGIDPIGYLETVNRLLATGAFDVLLPTHEQAWLFAAGRHRLSADAPVAVASAAAFAQVQGKIAFARLSDELGLPQPRWRIVDGLGDLADWPRPFYLKAPFSTAGTGVRRVMTLGDAEAAFEPLRAAADGGPLLAQAAAVGAYAQVQALFDNGRLVAAHTSAQTAVGMGSSAAGRVSVDHPFARRDIALLGAHLSWHGGLTLDYLCRDDGYAYIECNPRTVEPANAAASGVNLPELQIALSQGQPTHALPAGRPGIRTHSALAVLLGAAAGTGKRNAVFREALRLALHRCAYKKSRERLTPIFEDIPSAVPLSAIAMHALLSPRSAVRLAHSAVSAYSVTPQAVQRAASA